MKKYFLLFSFFIFFILSLAAHEGHEAIQGEEAASGGWISLVLWLGRLHLVFLHFPIALIIMTAISEILFVWYANPLFDHASRFMIVAAAVWAPITALFGFALGFGQFYEGWMNDIYAWHRYFGVVTTILVWWAATLREQYVRQKTSSLRSYYICLFFLVVCVNLTGLLGGTLAFGWG